MVDLPLFVLTSQHAEPLGGQTSTNRVVLLTVRTPISQQEKFTQPASFVQYHQALLDSKEKYGSNSRIDTLFGTGVGLVSDFSCDRIVGPKCKPGCFLQLYRLL
jgi:hypothetical protein